MVAIAKDPCWRAAGFGSVPRDAKWRSWNLSARIVPKVLAASVPRDFANQNRRRTIAVWASRRTEGGLRNVTVAQHLAWLFVRWSG